MNDEHCFGELRKKDSEIERLKAEVAKFKEMLPTGLMAGSSDTDIFIYNLKSEIKSLRDLCELKDVKIARLEKEVERLKALAIGNHNQLRPFGTTGDFVNEMGDRYVKERR